MTVIYKKLQEYLDELPIGFPATKSGVELRILKHLFTPEEAKIALNLIFGYEPVDVIHNRLKGSNLKIGELEGKLDTMVSKGLLNIKKENGKKLYGLALFIIGTYEYQVNRLEKSFLEDVSQYANEGLDKEFYGTKISQLRVIPIEKSLTPEHHAPPYEEIRTIIENAEPPIVVADCVCRKSKIVKGRPPCKATKRLETCLGFGHYAQMYLDQGWGRELTKAEAFELLEKNMEEGLVFQMINTTQDPYVVCSCCSCCCGQLDDLKEFPRPTEFVHTNYYAEIDSDLCVSCQTCIDRCPMNAIKMRKGIAKVLQRRCIGCGNCIPICPEEAIKLIKKEKLHIPPDTTDQLYDMILEKKKEIRTKNTPRK